MNVDNFETSGLVQVQYCFRFVQHHCLRTVLHRGHCAKLDLPRDCVQERQSLHKEKICAKRYVLVVLDNGRRYLNCTKRRNMRSLSFYGLAL
jgi:hypothetical protein